MKKAGFTMAEVLITLAIIGVVAALTIPTVVRNYQKTQTVTLLKKAYTQLFQAVNISEIENSSVDGWDYSLSAKNFYERHLKGNLKVIKDYGNIATQSMGVVYQKLNGDSASGYTIHGTWTYKIALSDGSIIFINPGSQEESFSGVAGPTKYYLFYIDTNGFKKPNRLGKDTFCFILYFNQNIS